MCGPVVSEFNISFRQDIVGFNFDLHIKVGVNYSSLSYGLGIGHKGSIGDNSFRLGHKRCDKSYIIWSRRLIATERYLQVKY